MEEARQLTIVQNLTFSEARQRAEAVFDYLDVNETTRDNYKRQILPFLKFIKRAKINNNTFLEFKRELTARVGISVSTKNIHLTTARIFLKELHRQGILPIDITLNVKSFSQIKKHKRDGLNQAEIDKISAYLQSLDNGSESTRLKALFSFLILQGLRQIEITRLTVRDIDLPSKTALVLGKGNDDKTKINLHPETVRNIEIYLKANKIADGWLFPSRSNKNLNKQISTRGLRRLIKDVLDDLGIDKNVHGMRHWFVSRLVKHYKGDLLEVARYTRHRSLEMLQVYNDNIKEKQDLPRYYKTFGDVRF